MWKRPNYGVCYYCFNCCCWRSLRRIPSQKSSAVLHDDPFCICEDIPRQKPLAEVAMFTRTRLNISTFYTRSHSLISYTGRERRKHFGKRHSPQNFSGDDMENIKNRFFLVSFHWNISCAAVNVTLHKLIITEVSPARLINFFDFRKCERSRLGLERPPHLFKRTKWFSIQLMNW